MVSMEEIEKIQNVATAYVIKNRNAVVDFYNLTDENKERIYNIAAAIICMRDNISQSGSFVKAIIENKLDDAISAADDNCIKAIRIFVLVRDNLYID